MTYTAETGGNPLDLTCAAEMNSALRRDFAKQNARAAHRRRADFRIVDVERDWVDEDDSLPG